MIDQLFTLIFLFASLIVVGIGYALYVFPWITRYLELYISEKEITDKKILVISDLHLFAERNCDSSILYKIVNDEKPDMIILAGDVLEYHKKVDEKTLKSLLEKCFFKSDNNNLIATSDIIYLTSLSSHDPILNRKEIRLEINDVEFTIIRGCIKLFGQNHNSIFICHGDYIARNGAVAGILNKVMSHFGKNLFLEKMLKKRICENEDDWLIMGHTHIPGIDYNSRVANTGAWKAHPLRGPSYTYVVIDFEKYEGEKVLLKSIK
ncbi:MAG: metallophosphoesterase family protein [Candidatus Asgardarchaeia archaeon]